MEVVKYWLTAWESFEEPPFFSLITRDVTPEEYAKELKDSKHPDSVWGKERVLRYPIKDGIQTTVYALSVSG